MKLVLRVAAVVAALPLLAALAFLGWDVATYDPAPWRRDYEHLKRELAQNYANLDWIVEHRGLDLAALDARTGAAIDSAHSRLRAFWALRSFVRAFEDPHLRLVRRQPESDASRDAPPPAVASCEAAGFEQSDDVAFTLPISALAGWSPTQAQPFAAGMAGDLGVIRIHAFGEDQYLETCEAAFEPGMSHRQLQLATRARLQAALRATIVDLRERGATRLAIDLTGNGGGTEWSSEAPALFTAATLTRLPGRLAAAQCDRTAIWRGEAVCPVLEPAGEPIMLDGEGAWDGQVFILTDFDTASASEDFIAWLQQSGGARVVGGRTRGAGCGYVGGGGWIRLSASPFDVRAPNCARFFNDGVNEIEGIAPDTEIDLEADALAAALMAATH
jgi:hypothetical protein